MATLVFTAVGTALGGPIGGAIGSFVGNQVDHALAAGSRQEGPRLKELAVTTSSYGTPLPRYFGQMRAAGTIIWATDFRENREVTGGGKGRPSVTSFNYTVSLAVALASRPIAGIGRIWADGNLLRGSAGDLKTGGTLRIYYGHGDQPADPLIASDRGLDCPAFRGLAYCVFEDLHLGDFGNRIPSLTFEILADPGDVRMEDLTRPLGRVSAAGELPGLRGHADQGGPISATLKSLADLYPLACDGSGDGLAITLPPALEGTEVGALPEPAIDVTKEGFGQASGRLQRRAADRSTAPSALRYYDIDRDYQAGLQRTEGRARQEGDVALEVPGVFDAQTARDLINGARERGMWARETLSWRLAEIDPAIKPGATVSLPGQIGIWRITTWEWREAGLELELERLPPVAIRQSPAHAGDALPAADLTTAPTLLAAFGLPWDGTGSGDVARCHVAASAVSRGWRGAALFDVLPDGGLAPAGHTGSLRAVIGTSTTALAPSRCVLLGPQEALEVTVAAADLDLVSASPQSLAAGANRALVGDEIIQFARAEKIGTSLWRLTGLLRGRGGTEYAATLGHQAGSRFVLLDDAVVTLDQALTTVPQRMAAIGLADPEPVVAEVSTPDRARTPLSPVHGTAKLGAAGLHLSWCRRARGSWVWLDQVDCPVNEQGERYLVGVGSQTAPAVWWDCATPDLVIDAAQLVTLAQEHPGAAIWVRQIGTHALSPPLLLSTLPLN